MAVVKNERITENIVRDELRRLGYFKKGMVVEEQKSEIEAVKRALRVASKTGRGGIGSPEFIISSPASPDFVVIVECKANLQDQVVMQQNVGAVVEITWWRMFAATFLLRRNASRNTCRQRTRRCCQWRRRRP